MMSVSARGGLVHVVMMIQSLTAEGITSLVRNSPKLMTLCLKTRFDESINNLKTTLKKMFPGRLLFKKCYCNVNGGCFVSFEDVLHDQGTNLLQLWR